MEFFNHPTGLFLLLFYILEICVATVTYVEWVDSDPARIGTTARIVCLFEVEFPFTFQYAEFTKILPDGTRSSTSGERVYVYELNRCSAVDRGYNDLEGRASAVLVEPDPGVMNTPVPGSIAGATVSPAGTTAPRSLRNSDGTVAVYDPESQAMIYTAGNNLPVATPSMAGEGVITLLIDNVTFTDQATYECAVKGIGGSRMTDLWNLRVVVLPSMPSLELVAPPAVEDRNISIACRTNLGTPAGDITWSRRAETESEFLTIPDDEVATRTEVHINGTTSAVSMFSFIGSEEDNGATYRCEVTSPNLRPWEANPTAEITLNVLYPPKNGRILFDAQVGRYLCVAQGNPQPEFMWLWVVGPDDRRIISTDRYLDLSVIEESGLFTFRCVASNVIDTVRNTRIMDTEIRVLGNPGGTRAPYHSRGHGNGYRTTESPRGTNVPIYHPNDVHGGYGDTTDQGAIDEMVRMATMTTTTTTPVPVQTRASVAQRDAGRSGRAGGFGGGGGGFGGGDDDYYEEITIIRPMKYKKHRNSHYGKENEEDENVEMEPLPAAATRATEADELPVWKDQDDVDVIISNLGIQLQSEKPKPSPITSKAKSFAKFTPNNKKYNLKKTEEPESFELQDDDYDYEVADDYDDHEEEDTYSSPRDSASSKHNIQKFKDIKRPDASMKEIADLRDASLEEFDIDPKTYYDPEAQPAPIDPRLNEGTTKTDRSERTYRPRRPLSRRRNQKSAGSSRRKGRFSSRRRSAPPRREKVGRQRSPHEPVSNNLLRSSAKSAKIPNFSKLLRGRTAGVSPLASSLLKRSQSKAGASPGNYNRQRPLNRQQVNMMTLAKLNALKNLQRPFNINRPQYRPRPNTQYDFIDKPFDDDGSFRNKFAKMAPESENEVEDYPVSEPDPFLQMESQHVVETVGEQYEPNTHRLVAAVAPSRGNPPPPPPRVMAPRAPSFSSPARTFGGVISSFQNRKSGDVKYEHEDAVLASHDEHDCRERADGPYGGGCLAFYRCKAGKTYYVECHEGYVFNRRAGRCDDAKNAPMPCGKWIDCAGKPSGKYANFDADCTSYHTCLSGVYFGSVDCPKGTAFDEEKGVCDWKENVPPPCGQAGIADGPRGKFEG